MFLDLEVGNLVEPLTGRHWDPSTVRKAINQRIFYYHENGLKPQSQVFLLNGNTLEFFVDLLAVWHLGACAIPIDPRLTSFEVKNLAKAAKPVLAIYKESLSEELAAVFSGLGVKTVPTPLNPNEFPDTEISKAILLYHDFLLEQDALILFTSGTTGDPKGVVHTHRTLRARWSGLRSHLGIERFKRTLCLLPTHFGHGLICNCLYPWLSGQDLFILPPFRPDLILNLGRILDEHQITFMSSVPSLWRLALKASKPPQKPSLHSVFCGSAPLSAYLWKEIQKWCRTKNVLNSYGITETGSWLAGTNLTQFEPEDGLIGQPWGTVIKILKSDSTTTPLHEVELCQTDEPGYVWLNTPALMKGYMDRPDLTKAVVYQGWFHTGDIGYFDHRGYLFLKGRVREEINKAGMKIHPADIDAVVEQADGVMDVCSFGYDDPHYGQEVGIALVLKKNDESLLRQVYDRVVKHLAKHKVPVRWYVLESIPRTSRGKVKRDQVAKECAKNAPEDLNKLFT